MTDKLRVCDYAKKVDKKSVDIINILNKQCDAGISKRGYSKTLEDDWIKTLDKHFKLEEQKKEEEKKKSKRKIVRVIRHRDEEEKEEAEKEEKPEEEKPKPAQKAEKVKAEEVKEKKAEEKPAKKKKEKPEPQKPAPAKKKAKAPEKEEKPEKKIKKKDKKKGVKKPEPKKETKTAKKGRKKKDKYSTDKFEEVETIHDKKKSAATSDDFTKKRKARRKKKKQIDKKKIAKSVEETIKSIKTDSSTSSRRKYKDKSKQSDETEEEIRSIKISDYIIVSDLAEKIDIDPVELIQTAIGLGIMVTINQRINFDNASILAMEHGFEVEKIESREDEEEDETKGLEDEHDDRQQKPRAPVVTVMGHVDHGKTTLIDYMRKSRIVESEHGKITQNIGAYTVESSSGKVTFIDTPGHEAFTAMRARGAQVTDIAVIVVAANDSVMPQTKEAIQHAELANIPFIIAINKTDLPEADPEKVKRDLLNQNIVVEDYGGKIPVVEISALTGKNVDELIDTILLQAELMELKAPVEGQVTATAIEVRQDKGLGPVINCIIQKGILRKGDVFVSGKTHGKVRLLLNEFNEQIEEAGPSQPVSVVGANDLPEVGDVLNTVEDQRDAKDIARQRHLAYREQLIKKREVTNVDSYERQLKDLKKKDLNFIIKGNVFGSIEALADSLQMLSDEEVKINVVYKEVGIVTENDVNIAIASDANIIAFSTSVSAAAKKYAKSENVLIKQYNVIYEVIDDITKAKLSLREPEYIDIETGRAEIRQLFSYSKAGTIAGCYVKNGYITRNGRVTVTRDGEDLGSYPIKSLKRFQDDVKKVESGYECAMILEGFEDIQKGDILRCIIREIKEPEL
ncbi:MAG: translation initiation factor IF-2 [bacterium]